MRISFAAVKKSPGQNVSDLQRFINLFGYSRVRIDGKLGPKTLQAIWNLPPVNQELLNTFSKGRGIVYPRASISNRTTISRADVIDKIKVEAFKQGVNSDFAVFIAYIESNLNPKAVHPSSKASGLFQLTSWAVSDVRKNNVARIPKMDRPRSEWIDIDWNISVGVSYLRIIMKDYLMGNPSSNDSGFLAETYAAYNLGISNFRRLDRGDFKNKYLLQALKVQANYLRAGGIENYLGIIQSRIESDLGLINSSVG